MPNQDRYKTKEEYNAYMRKWREKNREKIRAYNREYNKKWRKKNGYRNELNWAKKNPTKIKAQQAARKALSQGEIIKAPCARCGSDNAVMHHPDYSKPLAIVWLCKVHHRQEHYGYM